MLKAHALMESVSANLHEFLHSMDTDLTRPRKKFLSRLDRLEEHLNASDDLDAKVKATLPNLWLPMDRKDTPTILDLSDLAKPLAKKMDYLATVRDGSTGQLVNGYWLVELYASVSRKNPVSILLEPFSHEQALCPGQNPIILDAVNWVFELTEIRGWPGADSHLQLEDGHLPAGYAVRAGDALPDLAD